MVNPPNDPCIIPPYPGHIFLTGQVSLSYSIALCPRPHAEYNLLFASECKSLLATKATKPLNLLHLLLILIRALSTAHCLASITSPNKAFPQFLEFGYLVL